MRIMLVVILFSLFFVTWGLDIKSAPGAENQFLVISHTEVFEQDQTDIDYFNVKSNTSGEITYGNTNNKKSSRLFFHFLDKGEYNVSNYTVECDLSKDSLRTDDTEVTEDVLGKWVSAGQPPPYLEIEYQQNCDFVRINISYRVRYIAEKLKSELWQPQYFKIVIPPLPNTTDTNKDNVILGVKLKTPYQVVDNCNLDFCRKYGGGHFQINGRVANEIPNQELSIIYEDRDHNLTWIPFLWAGAPLLIAFLLERGHERWCKNPKEQKQREKDKQEMDNRFVEINKKLEDNQNDSNKKIGDISNDLSGKLEQIRKNTELDEKTHLAVHKLEDQLKQAVVGMQTNLTNETERSRTEIGEKLELLEQNIEDAKTKLDQNTKNNIAVKTEIEKVNSKLDKYAEETKKSLEGLKKIETKDSKRTKNTKKKKPK